MEFGEDFVCGYGVIGSTVYGFRRKWSNKERVSVVRWFMSGGSVKCEVVCGRRRKIG